MVVDLRPRRAHTPSRRPPSVHLIPTSSYIVDASQTQRQAPGTVLRPATPFKPFILHNKPILGPGEHENSRAKKGSHDSIILSNWDGSNALNKAAHNLFCSITEEVYKYPGPESCQSSNTSYAECQEFSEDSYAFLGPEDFLEDPETPIPFPSGSDEYAQGESYRVKEGLGKRSPFPAAATGPTTRTNPNVHFQDKEATPRAIPSTTETLDDFSMADSDHDKEMNALSIIRDL